MPTARNGHALAALATTRLGQVDRKSSCSAAESEGLGTPPAMKQPGI